MSNDASHGRVRSDAALRLRPLTDTDKAAFVAAHREMARDRFTFGLGYMPGMPWQDHLAQQEARRRGEQLPDGWVPNTSSSPTSAE